jgi:serine phosphatase RsbU (regulator of sigma subunit)
MKIRPLTLLACFLLIQTVSLRAQEVWDNSTRALYILDIAKYVQYDDKIQSHADFKIGVLGKDSEFVMDLYEMAKTRQFIQQKPIKIFQYPELDDIEKCHILYVNKKEGFNMKSVLSRTKGNNTLVIGEGYDFNEGMLNFIVVEGQPRFEVNEAKLNEENLHVSEAFLFAAVKNREDWEELFKVTEVALEEEKEVTREQRVIIDSQKVEIAEQDKKIHEQQELLSRLNDEIRLKQQTITEKTRVLDRQQKEIGRQRSTIATQQQEVVQQKAVLDEQINKISIQETQIAGQDDEIARKNEEIAEKDSVLLEQLKAIEKQKMLIWFFVLALILVSGLGYFIYRGYKIKKEANIQLEAKNKLIMAQKDEIQKQKEVAESQRDQIAYQKKHITDSIKYALRIQSALLPSLELFSDRIDHFVLYKPRDIVSGDFYWVAEVDNGSRQMIIASDCTGHGVPGAFMSMLGVSFLNEIVLNKGITQPDQVMNTLRDDVIRSLKQMEETSDVKDGMDMCICLLDLENRNLQFAGANNPLWIMSNGELSEIKGDKMPVAIHETMQPYTNHWIDLKKGDTFYIFSDGFADQFGGPNQKKFLSKNFKAVLGELQKKSMLEQGAELDRIFEEWRKEIEQVDDVTVIGVRV